MILKGKTAIVTGAVGGLGAAIDLAEKIKLFSYATSLGHAHSLLFYYPTDLYVDAAPYLIAEQKHRIRQWTGEGIVRAKSTKKMLKHGHGLVRRTNNRLGERRWSISTAH